MFIILCIIIVAWPLDYGVSVSVKGFFNIVQFEIRIATCIQNPHKMQSILQTLVMRAATMFLIFSEISTITMTINHMDLP